PNHDYRFVNTLSYRQDEVYSKTYFNGGYTEELLRASSNLSYRALDPLIINGGVMWEHSKLTGEYVSPQLGATLKLTPQASIRANVSKAYRTPDLYDQQAQWSYVFNGIRSIPANASGEEAEEITSYEIGYFQHVPRLGLTYDLSFYREELRKLVPSTKKYEDAVADGSLSRGYTYDADIEGVEFEVDWRHSNGAMVRATAAYQDTQTEEEKLLVTVAPLVTTLFISAPLHENIWFNTSYIYGEDMAEYDYKLLNTWLAYKVSNEKIDFSAGLGGSKRLD
ncbi:TonB-dependent receptor plug domain-containing protein, partial [Latilactobacillus sakei subsp. carnosus]